MTGKKVVFLIIAFSIIILVIAWFWLQHVIIDFNLDVSQAQPLSDIIRSEHNSFVLKKY